LIMDLSQVIWISCQMTCSGQPTTLLTLAL
jgi:hypothetical protein